ncbi:serine recombinase [Clostridium carboxidivorans P7]|uniref:Resolvase domain protein n=1 Tax=Clostridium carboxidivorans P7 TaxID=536227 RepID=C6PZQ4_9CLOT|nr:recombinase family protein [Clostridium carboxidivorans]AKN32632.1 serine recombinase [Clostridium carboxidivorans P7]EET85254.1 Resolvase domain protein [Clostridium carboxidivorans P7]EFG90144.1 resolvase [Clostridium carboxidivorans P7]
MIAAIYSRKSVFTGKGESIENQVQMCKEYGEKNLGIKDFIIYEDEGFSGGNINRPNFQELLQDVKNKKFDVLICYRLDRISRNVADFSTTLELLQRHSIAFVSIKEQFDTTTPMGKAMIYIASVFAQLERETIAERVRDNMLQLAKTGRWLGGQTPLGYESEQINYFDEEMKERSMYKLTGVKEELDNVKVVYEKFLETKSLNRTFKWLYSNGIKTKKGGEWNAQKVKDILSNPIYVQSSDEVLAYLKSKNIIIAGEANGNGILSYNKTKNLSITRDMSEWICAVSKHKGIIKSEEWLEVQKILDSKKKGPARIGTSQVALLTKVLRCSKCGSLMFVKHGHKSTKNGNKRYCYYVCTKKDNSNGKLCNCKNVRVDILENLVIDNLKELNKETILKELLKTKKELSNVNKDSALENIKEKINDVEQSIKNLLKQLAKSRDKAYSKFIESDLEELNNELENLQAEYNNISSQKEDIDKREYDIDLMVQSLKYFNKNINAFKDINNRRLLIESVVDSIIWDGDTEEIEINLWGVKKN